MACDLKPPSTRLTMAEVRTTPLALRAVRVVSSRLLPSTIVLEVASQRPLDWQTVVVNSFMDLLLKCTRCPLRGRAPRGWLKGTCVPLCPATGMAGALEGLSAPWKPFDWLTVSRCVR